MSTQLLFGDWFHSLTEISLFLTALLIAIALRAFAQQARAPVKTLLWLGFVLGLTLATTHLLALFENQKADSSQRSVLSIVKAGTVFLSLLLILLLSRLTPQVLAKVRAAEQSEEVRRQQQLINRLVQSMQDGVIAVSNTGRILVVNKAAEKLLQGSLQDTELTEWSGHFGLFLPDGQGQYPPEQLPLTRALQGETVHRAQIIVQRQDMHEAVWLDVTASPLLNDEGETVGGVSVFRDISEQKKSEEQILRQAEELKKANERLKQANQDLDEFTYVASHDLQEPTRNLLAYSALLEEDLTEPPQGEAAEDLRQIKLAAKRMQDLIQALLALSRAGRAPIELQPIELDLCVDRALASLHSQIQETRAIIEKSDLPIVQGDATLLTQLFQNLISNAIKFTDGGVPQIEISAWKEGEKWVIGVRDQGIGIEKQHQEQIFQPFKRLHSRMEHPGSGVGLAICQRCVERLGGQMGVESEKGQGSLFYFTLD